MSSRPSCREDFEVAIICALPLEYDAVALLFDEFWDEDGDPYKRAAGDPNVYTTGRMGKHDVVLALLPHMGKINAASAAAHMRTSYRGLRLVILAGICGGVPYNGREEILLGDVVISKSLVQYDFGRRYPDKFSRKDTVQDNLRKNDRNISSLLAIFDTVNGRDKLRDKTSHFLKQLQERALDHQAKYEYPGISEDRQFESSYRHKHRDSATCICSKCHGRNDPACDKALGLSCDELGCNGEYLVPRKRLRVQDEHDKQDKATTPAIHIGTVASGDTVMKSGEDRDRIAREEGVIAFEMEGAGVWEEIPCIVVKGVCDYADCHKDKKWQDFAAATAASASKAILERYIQTDRGERPIQLERDSVRLDDEPPESHFLVPFGRNQDFVGRQSILSELVEKIRPSANKDDCQRTALEGLGGVGKTQLAIEASYLIRNEHPDCSVFWVPALDAASFESAYRDIGKHLKVKNIDDNGADVKQLVKAALSEESSGSWLLVVDNADDVTLLFGAAGLSAHMPFSRRGSILFTTRNHEAAVRLDIPSRNIIHVVEMGQDEALSLLQHGLTESQTSNTEATKRLLDLLANLPLAIRQASAYMAAKYISTVEYLGLCESDDKDMIDLLSRDFEDRHRYREVQNPVATTWLISFNQILKHNPLAAEYLKFMSMLAEKGIPKSFLPPAKAIDAIDAIGTLKAYAFIAQREGCDSFDMHRLVRLAMRNWLEKEGQLKQCTRSAIRRLNQVFPFPTSLYEMGTWVGLLTHARAVLKLVDESAGDREEAYMYLFRKVMFGNCVETRDEPTERMSWQVIDFWEKTFGKTHPSTLSNRDVVALILVSAERLEEAEKIQRQTLELRKELVGEHHPSTLVTMNSIAKLLADQRKPKEAEKMFRQLHELHVKVLGEGHPRTLINMDNLATILRLLGHDEEAQNVQRQVIELRENSKAACHAVTTNALGQDEEAEKALQELLELDVLGNI
ncbi:purine and uridine phosphorylase [Trichoderma citrinoviride]|uniref:Purine and uridine phosphorylase n=1 Tax=Trichoderma citrinoviride TaxID=58853 RepID=A0A2T4B0D2_9HYPO|nr:purine and uridine phosphorylase [Trichoderma citrinoviride]PTB62779.1 purine and uridine phosphorylase [Trichoderma citrinoviride]